MTIPYVPSSLAECNIERLMNRQERRAARWLINLLHHVNFSAN